MWINATDKYYLDAVLSSRRRDIASKGSAVSAPLLCYAVQFGLNDSNKYALDTELVVQERRPKPHTLCHNRIKRLPPIF